MSTIKTTNQTGKYHDPDALNDIISYILQPDKALHGFVGGFGVDPQDITTSMLLVADRWGKTTGIQLHHFILSFSPAELSDPTILNEIAKAASIFLAQDYQVVFAVHENKPHLHAHIVINAVSYKTGRKYHGSKAEFYRFVNHINLTLQRYNLPHLHYIPARTPADND